MTAEWRIAGLSKILVIEDEAKISRFVELELKHEGYEAECSGDGREGLEKALSPDIDLVLLDLMLPSLSGIEVCRRLRQTSDVPVIMLTAKDDVADKVAGFNIGADDYMTKPFAIEELLVRIRVALGRRKKEKPAVQEDRNILHYGKLEVDVAMHTVKYDGEEIAFTKKEYDLLEYLMKNKNNVVSREQLLNQVWGYEYFGDTNVVDVYVRYLRKKIDDKYNIHTIETIRGVGYIIKDNA